MVELKAKRGPKPGAVCDCTFDPYDVGAPMCSVHWTGAWVDLPDDHDVGALMEMRPMETAPRNQTHILAKTLPRSDHDRFASYGGRWFVVWHVNTFDGAEDWSLFPGFSVDPEWFEGWTHLPLSAATTLATLQARVDALEVENAGLRPKQVPTTVTHYCKHEPDGCTSHNLHCQWPACAAPRTGAAT